jgi:hypothetical protein
LLEEAERFDRKDRRGKMRSPVMEIIAYKIAKVEGERAIVNSSAVMKMNLNLLADAASHLWKITT